MGFFPSHAGYPLVIQHFALKMDYIYIFFKNIYIYSPYSDLLIQMVIFHMLVYQRIPGSIRLDI